MIAIIGAMQEEIDILIDEMIEVQQMKMGETDFYQGQLNGRDVVVSLAGIGKVNAALTTTILIQKYNPSRVINIGVAGSLSNKVNVLDTVYSTECTYHDVDATHFGYDIGQVPQMVKSFNSDEYMLEQMESVLDQLPYPIHKGQITSGDQFIGTIEQKNKVTEVQPEAIAVDMESTAIAHVCHRHQTPFLIIRSISDNANGEAMDSYEEFLEESCKRASNIVKLLLRNMID